jgi:hypothetical protein
MTGFSFLGSENKMEKETLENQEKFVDDQKLFEENLSDESFVTCKSSFDENKQEEPSSQATGNFSEEVEISGKIIEQENETQNKSLLQKNHGENKDLYKNNKVQDKDVEKTIPKESNQNNGVPKNTKTLPEIKHLEKHKQNQEKSNIKEINKENSNEKMDTLKKLLLGSGAVVTVLLGIFMLKKKKD